MCDGCCGGGGGGGDSYSRWFFFTPYNIALQFNFNNVNTVNIILIFVFFFDNTQTANPRTHNRLVDDFGWGDTTTTQPTTAMKTKLTQTHTTDSFLMISFSLVLSYFLSMCFSSYYFRFLLLLFSRYFIHVHICLNLCIMCMCVY